MGELLDNMTSWKSNIKKKSNKQSSVAEGLSIGIVCNVIFNISNSGLVHMSLMPKETGR